MVKIVSAHQYYDANFTIKAVTGGFSIEGDMIQRAELCVRLEHILLEELSQIAGVPETEIMMTKSFQLYLAYKQFCIIAFQTTISESDLEKLSNCIDEVFRLIKEIDPSCSTNPKLHFHMHYVALIRYFGPLIYFSSLPFERKHQYFKAWARVIHNMVNPALSMAVRHQYYVAATFNATEYCDIEFEFDKKLTSDPSADLHDTPPMPSTFLTSFPPLKLYKNVVRRIGVSNKWIQVTRLLKDSSNKVFVGGVIFEKSSDLQFGLPILTNLFELKYIEYNELYHVNDFIYSLKGKQVVIAGII